jgi:hypothetical protein
VQQLTIDDFLGTFFDESRAIVKKIMEIRYCDVLAYIPKDALSPEELGRLGLDYESEEYQSRKEKWSDYVYAIWQYQKWSLEKFDFDWCEAIKLMGKHRDEGIPAEMRISLNGSFRPEHVVEYLETK